MRNGYNLDTLTLVDICETAKMGGKKIEIHEGVIYRENFRISPVRRIKEELFNLKRKYKNENFDIMQGLVKSVMNSLCGVQIREDNNESF